MWVAVLALLPVTVLYVGRPGDDAVFHVSSWMEMAAGWKSGVWAPAWAAQANFGLGEPRFMFYPPLTIVLGAALRMVLPAIVLPGVMVWLVLVVAGWAMLRLANEVLSQADCRPAALLYVTSYYLLVVALLRFAMGELLAVALLPLVVLFVRVLRLEGSRWRDLAGLAMALAGVWVSDVPASLAAFYVLAAVALVECIRRRKVTPLLMLGAAETGAVGLVGCYMVPAMLERGKIGATNLLNHAPVDFMLWHRPAKGLTPAMTYPLWMWVLVGTASAVWLGMRSRPDRGAGAFGVVEDGRRQLRLLAWMAGVALLFQLPLSLPLWRTLPQLGFVQFPYRFDGMLGCVLPVLCLLLVQKMNARRWMYAVWGVFVVVALGTKVMQERTGRGGITFAEIVRQVGIGYAGCPEFSTKGMPSPEPRGAERVRSLGACVSSVEVWAPQRRLFDSEGNEDCLYRVGLRYFPDWRMWVDGREAQGISAGTDGLMRVIVPAGKHEVELRYIRPRLAEALGDGVSALTLLGVAGLWILASRRRTPIQSPEDRRVGAYA
jgi:uncharacterized membrane protein